MLNEMSSLSSESVAAEEPPVPAAPYDTPEFAAIREAVAEVFDIRADEAPIETERGVAFVGTFREDSGQAYDRLDARLAALDYFPVFRQRGDDLLVEVIRGRFATPAPRPWWPNAVLLILTLLSMLYVGAGIALGEALIESPERQLAELWRGWPYALSLALILGAHELGHYLAARRHGVAVTLPYFLPFPFGMFGTLGAFIQLRTPMRSRRAMLDIGASGPLAGLIFTIPILVLGLLTADVRPLPTDVPYILEGNSLLYALAKFLIFGRMLPDGRMDVFMNQLVQAGWTGLFVTGLNLLPVGQLDGGHILYTLFGDRARLLYFPAVLLMGFLAWAVAPAWWLWVFLLVVFGRIYATPLDSVTPLGRRRVVIAVIMLVLFILVFVPNPFQIVQPVQLPPVQIY